MSAYYNEIDPYCCEWLRNLIAEGLIAPGYVDERPIQDVTQADIQEFSQCHFFAGLGGWSYALRLAGVSDERPIWTASAPCQPFSVAGSSAGHGDERHLWPIVSALIRERKPPVIFGEQVARAIGMGWLDAVAADLEAQAYAFGAAVLPACSIGAPHIRNRVWFVADARGGELRHEPRRRHGQGGADQAITRNNGAQESLADADAGRQQVKRFEEHDCFESPPGHLPDRCGARRWGEGAGESWWSIEPDVGRVAHGVPCRVGKLRAIGNAIVPQVAAEFIRGCV